MKYYKCLKSSKDWDSYYTYTFNNISYEKDYVYEVIEEFDDWVYIRRRYEIISKSLLNEYFVEYKYRLEKIKEILNEN